MGEAVKVSIDGRAMVRPAQPSPPLPFFLSSLDIFWQIFPYNRRLIFYESTHISGAALLHQLRTSLALCLVHYYPWCGRIARGPLPPHRLFIDCNDAGVEFVEASCDLPLSTLAPGRFQMNPSFLQLSQHPDHMGDSLYHSPLLSIQATVFSDGGLTLGITQSHIVADGGSLWNFMVSWGECSRGVALSLPPLHDRGRLAVPEVSPEKVKWAMEVAVDEMEDSVVDHDDNLETGSPTGGGDKDRSCSNAEKESTGGTVAGPGTEKPNPDPLVQCLFDLPSLAVKKLKGEAGEGLTSYEVMCAHFWQRLTIARQIPGRDPIHFASLVNCRTRVTPPLSPAYFGNVIAFAVALSTAGKICGESLRVTARRIHQTIAKTQEERLVSFMHWLESNNNQLVSVEGSKPLGKGINVASSPRFPAYQVDFGWGTPIAVRAVKAGEGELILFGGRPGALQGDVEICTALPDSVLRRLLEDPGFLAKPPGSPYTWEYLMEEGL